MTDPKQPRQHEAKPKAKPDSGTDSGPAPEIVAAACRTCGQTTTSECETFPFCSDRCRMADLGKWFNEDYRISRAIKDTDIEAGD